MSEPKKLKIIHNNDKDIDILNNNLDECLPLKSLEDLKNWKLLVVKHASSPLRERVFSENQPKTLVCHDMKGGYLDDRFINGSNSEDNYYFLHWMNIDIFVYFSHHFITIPPCGWISAAHKNGVKILGTFITEWDDGVKICEEFFGNEDTVTQFCTQLVKIADHYNFDGWLINIENKLQICQIPLLTLFLMTLTKKMHSCNKDSQVIWYDSVLQTGDLKWQNALNEHNRIFFDCCDGIFLNYNWTEETLQQSAALSGERKIDVYVGADVFGRGCPGGGGFCTNIAVSAARKFGLSTAIFAPGWIYECLEVKDFKENQMKFWSALQEFCIPKAITHKNLPYYTSFCPGFGKKLFKDGKIISHEPWFNLSIQQPQPIYHTDSDKLNISLSTEYSFNGGGCICVSGHSKNEANITSDSLQIQEVLMFKILKTSFLFDESIAVSYTFKPLSPNVEVALVLHMKSSESPENSNYNLNLTGKQHSSIGPCSTYLLPASEDEIIKIGYKMSENPKIIQNWEKRLFILKLSNFANHRIEDISIKVTALQNEKSSILFGELEILPLYPKIDLKYRNLECSYDSKNNVTVKCILVWSYHPSIHYSDLYIKNADERKHICRTSQFYYNLELSVSKATELVILLSFQNCGNEYFSDISLNIPLDVS